MSDLIPDQEWKITRKHCFVTNGQTKMSLVEASHSEIPAVQMLGHAGLLMKNGRTKQQAMVEAREAMEADEKEAETLQSELTTTEAAPTQGRASFDFEREWDDIDMSFPGKHVHSTTPSTRHAIGSHDTNFDPPLHSELDLPTSSTTGRVDSRVVGYDTSAVGRQDSQLGYTSPAPPSTTKSIRDHINNYKLNGPDLQIGHTSPTTSTAPRIRGNVSPHKPTSLPRLNFQDPSPSSSGTTSSRNGLTAFSITGMPALDFPHKPPARERGTNPPLSPGADAQRRQTRALLNRSPPRRVHIPSGSRKPTTSSTAEELAETGDRLVGGSGTARSDVVGSSIAGTSIAGSSRPVFIDFGGGWDCTHEEDGGRQMTEEDAARPEARNEMMDLGMESPRK
jgi:hypothetical protein